MYVLYATLTCSSSERIMFWKRTAMGLHWGRLELTLASWKFTMPSTLQSKGRRAERELHTQTMLCTIPTGVHIKHIPLSQPIELYTKLYLHPPISSPIHTPNPSLSLHTCATTHMHAYLLSNISTSQLSLVLISSTFFR